jgi:hypothetical protein
MRRAFLYSQEVFQGETVRFQNRITDTAGVALTADAVTNWSMRAYENGALVKKIVDNSTDSTTAFFNTLQTGNGWDIDATGYNFEYVMQGDAFKMEGGKSYRIEFDARTETEKVKWVWTLRVLPWMGTT